MAYQITLPLSLANIHDVFQVSQLRRYISNLSHVVQVDDVQVRDDLTVEGNFGRTYWGKCDLEARELDEGVVSDSIELFELLYFVYLFSCE